MGTVLSPDYPEGYGNNLNCVWLIISEPGTRIHLAFNDFDLEPPYDFLTIKDGDQSGTTLMGRFSGAEVPSHLTSNSNVLQLEFQADHSMSGRGFNITYSSKILLDEFIVALLYVECLISKHVQRDGVSDGLDEVCTRPCTHSHYALWSPLFSLLAQAN